MRKYYILWNITSTSKIGKNGKLAVLRPHEPIEITGQLIDVQHGQLLNTFHSFIKTKRPISSYCAQTANVTRAAIKKAPSLSHVLLRWTEWIEEVSSLYKIKPGSTQLVVFGSWPLLKCLPLACEKEGIEVPDSLGTKYHKTLIDLQKSMVLLTTKTPDSVEDCLDCIGLRFNGSPGNCLDQSLNLLQLLRSVVINNWKLVSSIDADTIMMEFDHSYPHINISHLKQKGKSLQFSI